MPARRPEECDALFEQHVNAGNLEAVLALYEPQATFVTQERQVAAGKEGIRGALADLVAMKPTMKLKVTQVAEAGGDLAVLYSDWSMSAKASDGTPLNMTGKSIEVVRRQADGTWCFVVDDPFARS